MKRGRGQHAPYVPKAKPLVLIARLLLAASKTLCQLTASRLASFVKKPSAKWYPRSRYSRQDRVHAWQQPESEQGFQGDGGVPFSLKACFLTLNLGEAGGQFTHKSRGEAGRNLGSSTATRTSHLPPSGRQWKNCALREEPGGKRRIPPRGSQGISLTKEKNWSAKGDLNPLRRRLGPVACLTGEDTAASPTRRRDDGKPATFNFLGFTHLCGKTQQGWFTVVPHTMRQRWQATLREVNAELQRRRHHPIPDQGAYLRSVLVGHVRCYGVPMNSRAISALRLALGRLWRWVLERRSHRTRIPCAHMLRLITRWLAPARVCHPYPLVRLGVATQGGSRMPSCRTSGSVEGVQGDLRSTPSG